MQSAKHTIALLLLSVGAISNGQLGGGEHLKNIYFIEMLVAFTLSAMRGLVVATKYGFFQDSWNTRLRGEQIDHRTWARSLFVPSWQQPTDEDLSVFLEEAIARLGLDLSSMTFHAHQSSSDKASMLCPCVASAAGPVNNDGVSVAVAKAIPVAVFDVLKPLVRNSFQRFVPRLSAVVDITSYVAAALPCIMRGMERKPPFGHSALEVVVAISCIVIVQTMLRANMLFLVLACSDVFRRLMASRALHKFGTQLFRLPEYEHSDEKDLVAIRKRFPSSFVVVCPVNVTAFLVARRVVFGVGLQFEKRTQLFCAFYVSLCLSILGMTVADIAKGRTLEVITAAVLGVYMLVLIVCLIPLLVMALVLNDMEGRKARTLLARHANMVQWRVAGSSRAARQGATCVTEACDNAITQLTHDKAHTPGRLMGIRLTLPLVTSFSSLLVSLSFVVLRSVTAIDCGGYC